jgi:polyisoprenoid-binding protein YceI
MALKQYVMNLLKTMLLLFTMLMVISVAAQYKPIETSSTVQFKIKHFGIRTNGSFKGIDGIINFDINHLNNSNFDVSIDANTINTENELRDNNLRDKDYFDVAKYSRIRFISTKIIKTTYADTLLVTGMLTIKDTTKNISFPFTIAAVENGLNFMGIFTINRRDFGIGGTSVISDNLEVELNIVAKK